MWPFVIGSNISPLRTCCCPQNEPLIVRATCSCAQVDALRCVQTNSRASPNTQLIKPPHTQTADQAKTHTTDQSTNTHTHTHTADQDNNPNPGANEKQCWWVLGVVLGSACLQSHEATALTKPKQILCICAPRKSLALSKPIQFQLKTNAERKR